MYTDLASSLHRANAVLAKLQHFDKQTKRSVLPKICNTYLKMMKRGTGMPYLRKIKKI